MTKERRLGRGLEALLSRTREPAAIDVPGRPPASPDQAAAGESNPAGGASVMLTGGDGLLRLGVSDIEANPYQPRREFDDADLQALADSILAHGILQPVVVRQVEGRYQLIAGERRLRAAIKAGCATVPAHLVTADEQQVAELAIVENLQRKDLNALEKAASFQQYIQRYQCSQEELAGRLKIDRSTVANLIRLLELPVEVQDAVRQGRITAGHARALLPLGDDREQIKFCLRIQEESLSVRNTETYVQDIIHSADAEPLAVVTSTGETRPAPRKSKHLASLEQTMRLALGTKVEIRQSAKGRGKITIHFANAEEFERIQAQLCPSAAETQPRQAMG
ncbi:MAG: ParB/RepB/Spo0J family partition protein [Pirellulales bacterium]